MNANLQLRRRDLYTRSLLQRRKVTQADIDRQASMLQSQMVKCDSIKYERDNVTPGPDQKKKKDKLAKDLDACKNAYMQMKTKLDRLRDDLSKGKR